MTHRDAQRALEDFVERRLVDFGPYQDALVDGQPTLAHSLLSAPLNVGLLSAREACQAVLAAYHDPSGEQMPSEGAALLDRGVHPSTARLA